MERVAPSKGYEGAYWKLIGRHRGGGESNHTLISRESLLKQKPTQTTNKILQGQVLRASTEKQGNCAPGGKNFRQGGDVITDGRMLPRELLDDGQGKLITSDRENSDSTDGSSWRRTVTTMEAPSGDSSQHRLLWPPVTVATGSLATGATTEALRKQNKHQRNESLLKQPMASQWTIHRGNTILPHNH